MSNEIKIAATMNVANGSLIGNHQPGLIQVDQTEARRGGHCQTIGATAETVDLGDLQTYGYAYFRNNDDTYTIDVGPQEAGSGGTIVPMCSLKPGEIAILRIKDGITLMAQCTGGSGTSADLDVNVYGD